MESKNRPINEVLTITMQKVRELVDVNTIVGQPIQAEGVTLIPVSRVSLGFGTGGTEFSSKNQKPGEENAFGGGSGAGVSIKPVAFLVVKGDSVRLLPVEPPNSAIDRVIDMVPELMDRVGAFLDKQQEKKDTDHF